MKTVPLHINYLKCDSKNKKIKLENFICRPVKYMDIPEYKEQYDNDTPKDKEVTEPAQATDGLH